MVLLFIIALLFASCTNSNSPTPENHEKNLNAASLNITVFLDLSDRIDTLKYPGKPQQYQKDISDIACIVDVFKQKLEHKKIYDLNDKLRVLFHPLPVDDSIATIASRLSIDLAGQDRTEILEIYHNIDELFLSNCDQLYSIVRNYSGQQERFPGSNIWRFIKDNRDQFVNDDTTFRNILFIITDGYMYYDTDHLQDGKRYNFIERESSHLKRFRDPQQLETNFEKDDYGFIPVQQDLSNLEIYVIEVSPDQAYPRDYDILKRYWEKWFDEMNVKKYRFIESNLPSITQRRIVTLME